MAGKLGKLPARHDPRTLRFENYRTNTPLPQLPAAHWGHGLDYGMLGNDVYGDCVEAAYAHFMQIATTRAGGTVYSPAESDALTAYTAMTGFNPAVPSTDNGTDMLTACNYWQDTGMAGLEIDAFLAVSPLSAGDVQDAVAYYGGLYAGFQLPLSAQSQTGSEWTVTTGPDAAAGSWGGHCVPIVGYAPGVYYCITWGAIQSMTAGFFETYCDEAFCLLAHEWIGASGDSPSGLAWGLLQADLANLGA